MLGAAMQAQRHWCMYEQFAERAQQARATPLKFQSSKPDTNPRPLRPIPEARTCTTQQRPHAHEPAPLCRRRIDQRSSSSPQAPTPTMSAAAQAGNSGRDAAELKEVQPSVRVRTLTETPPGEAPMHFQIVDLGRQYYVWVGTGTPKLGNLHLAIQSSVVSGDGGG